MPSENKQEIDSFSKEKKIKSVLFDIQGKLRELEDLRKGLKSSGTESISAKQSKEMLEEITVPSLESIRHVKKKRPD